MKKLVEDKTAKFKDVKAGDWVRLIYNPNQRFSVIKTLGLKSSVIAYIEAIEQKSVSFSIVDKNCQYVTDRISVTYYTKTISGIQKLSKLENRLLDNIFILNCK